jgi:hypothetical protein
MNALAASNSQLDFLKPLRNGASLLRSGSESCSLITPETVILAFMESHDDLEVSVCYLRDGDTAVSGKICPSFVRGFDVVAIRTKFTPDLIDTFKHFRLTPSWIVRRGQTIEAVWMLAKPHVTDPADAGAKDQKWPHLPYAEYQAIQRNLAVELGVEPLGDGLWMLCPNKEEVVFESRLPYDASELLTPLVSNPIREALTRLAENGVLVGSESAAHPDRCFSHALMPYLKSFPGLAAETYRRLSQLLREHGITEWRTAAANGHKFPPLSQFRKTLACRYGHIKWSNQRVEWSTN